MAEDYIYRLATTRKKIEHNPKYTYWNKESNEPRYFILDETVTTYSKIYRTIGAAKGARTRDSYSNTDTLVSVVIERAEIVWQSLAEEEL